MDKITLADIDALALGSAFLGTGGGGDPHIGAMLCREAIAKHGPVTIISADELADDAAVFVAAGMGAPTVIVEKLFSVEDAHQAVCALERHLGRTASAIIAAEIGGINSTMPVAYAAMRGLPVVDADGMGRAFPSIDMVTFNVAGVSCTPMALADEHGNVAIFETATAKTAEDLARPVVAAMGASVSLSCYPMTGRQVKGAAVSGTLSAALSIGKAMLSPGEDAPVDRLLATLRSLPYYNHAFRIFDGKIVELQRNTTSGWVFGRCEIASLDQRRRATVNFQNENLSVQVDGRMRALVPDLICIVDSETGRAIPTERLRYGQRVSVLGCSAPAPLRSPEALKIMGPQAFRLNDPYVEIETLLAGSLENIGETENGEE
jgi:DUF917 family protein